MLGNIYDNVAANPWTRLWHGRHPSSGTNGTADQVAPTLADSAFS